MLWVACPQDALGLAAELARHSASGVTRCGHGRSTQRQRPCATLQVTQVQEEVGPWVERLGAGFAGRFARWSCAAGSSRHTGAVLDESTEAQQVFLVREDGHAGRVELARFDLGKGRPAGTKQPAAVRAVTHAGLQVQLLSGDRSKSVARVAGQAGIADYAQTAHRRTNWKRCGPGRRAGSVLPWWVTGWNDGPAAGGCPRVVRFWQVGSAGTIEG